ncbi:MAG: SHOCT domain-containing protein [Eubacterium sp.]
MDKKIMKYLPTVLCILMLISLLLPFVSVGASMSIIGVSGSSETAANGFTLISDGSFLAILLPLMPIIIIVSNYISSLAAYKKYICLGCSAFTILWLLIIPKLTSSASAEGASFDISVNRLIGFWIMLACAILLTFLYLIPFINKNNNAFLAKLNPFPDDISEENIINKIENNNETDSDKKINIPQVNIDKDKITGFAKNMANTIGEQGRNIANKTTEQVKNVADNIQTNHTINAKVRNEKPEEIMEQLRKLNELKETGILTEEEFTTKKQEMLERI